MIRGLEAVADRMSEIGKLYVGTSGMDKSLFSSKYTDKELKISAYKMRLPREIRSIFFKDILSIGLQ